MSNNLEEAKRKVQKARKQLEEAERLFAEIGKKEPNRNPLFPIDHEVGVSDEDCLVFPLGDADTNMVVWSDGSFGTHVGRKFNFIEILKGKEVSNRVLGKTLEQLIQEKYESTRKKNEKETYGSINHGDREASREILDMMKKAATLERVKEDLEECRVVI